MSRGHVIPRHLQRNPFVAGLAKAIADKVIESPGCKKLAAVPETPKRGVICGRRNEAGVVTSVLFWSTRYGPHRQGTRPIAINPYTKRLYNAMFARW